MKLLFLSNFYPPEARGGYEQWCQEVAHALADRGHIVTVITSRAQKRHTGQPGNPEVQRILELEVLGGVASTLGRLVKRRRSDRWNLCAVRSVLEKTGPDAALIWGMWNVPRSVPALVEQLLPDRTAYYFCDYWPSLPSAFLQQLDNPSRRRITALPKQLIGRLFRRSLARDRQPALQFVHPICVSAAVRRLLVQAGIPVSHAKIIRGGTVVSSTLPAARPSSNGRLKLAYLGRLTAEKGVHTAIQAVAILASRGTSVRLDIWGKGDADYERGLRELASDSPVRFCGSVAPNEVTGLLARYDALVFPSEWDEPFARTVLEGMAAQVAVIGTTTGGTGEILTDGETGLSFVAGDATSLAEKIALLVHNPELACRLGGLGHATVREHFSFDRMVGDLEGALQAIARRELDNAEAKILSEPPLGSRVPTGP
jgi:glycogen synthase